MTNLKRYTLYILNIIDILCFMLVYYPAYFLSFSGLFRPHDVYSDYDPTRYSFFFVAVILAYVIVNILSLYSDDKFMERTWMEELIACIKLAFTDLAIVLVFFYLLKISWLFSRMFLIMFFFLFVVFDFALRLLVKKIILPKYQLGKGSEKIVVIADADMIETVVSKLNEKKDWRYEIIGAVVRNDSGHRDNIMNVPVIAANIMDAKDFIETKAWSVIYSPGSLTKQETDQEIKLLLSIGKIIHYTLDEINVPGAYKKIDTLGSVPVMTYYMGKPVAKRALLFTQLADTLICLLFIPLLAAVSLITAVLNLLFSKGPLFNRYVRVGRNGHRYYLLRFRVLNISPDREEGRGKYSPAGRILCFFHLDGLPQILNVISQEMSIVGPKPVSLAKYISLTREERGQYLLCPGIVGRWSVSMDYEIERDNEEWSLGRTILIVLEAILRYLSGTSLRKKWYGEVYEESVILCRELLEEYQPLQYPRTMEPRRQNIFYLIFKRLADIVISVLGIIVCLPVYLLVSVLIIIEDGGMPFYSHSRIGMEGKRIRIYKFRTMREDAGDINKLLTPEQLEEYRKEFKIRDDPRITKIGTFLRQSSIDELPQLFNVLGGSLSLIGPRPVVEEETVNYGDQLEKFLSVKPGLTGYWQAYARNNVGYNDGKRQAMELYYVDHQSLLLDLRIFFKTIGTVISKEGSM